MGKEHFPKIFINGFAFFITDTNGNISEAQTHQFLTPAFRCFQRNQRRIQLGDCMPCGFCHAVTVPCRACIRIRKSPRCHNNSVKRQFFLVFQTNPCDFALFHDHMFHLTFQMKGNFILPHIFFQSLYHVQRTVCHRKYPVAPFHFCFQSHVQQKLTQCLIVKTIKGTVHEIRIAGDVIQKGIQIPVICYITATFAGNEYFLS